MLRLVIGALRAGLRGTPGISEGAVALSQTSIDNSAISTNSRSKMHFTNLGGRAAAGLYWFVWFSDGLEVMWVSSICVAVPVPSSAIAAAVASRLRGELTDEKVGMEFIRPDDGIVPRGSPVTG